MSQIEVIVEATFLTSDDPVGRYRVRVDPNATVETLLRQVCKEANTPCHIDYCLQSKERSSLLRTDVLSNAGVEDGSFLIWTRQIFGADKVSSKCNIFWFLAIVAFLIGVAGIVAICIIKFKNADKIIDYAIVFDAGSSHTSMFIYKWEGSKYNGTAVAVQAGKSCPSQSKAKPISSFVNNPSLAGKSLEPCLKEAKNRIPKHKYDSTPIYLGATAGMRLLRESNRTASDAILESIRTTVKKYPFELSDPDRMISILTGQEEGTYSWVSTNYITNAFNVLQYRPYNDGKVYPRVYFPTFGAMDLGGASTQISFFPASSTVIPKEFSKTTQLFGHNYTLYSHSYLCYGINEAIGRVYAALVKDNGNNTLIQHPCLFEGYNETKSHDEIFSSPCVSGKEGLRTFGSTIQRPSTLSVKENYTFVGTSYPKQCHDLISGSLFNFTAPCPYQSCSFNGIYQPPVDGQFYAFSTYYYVTRFLNLTQNHDSFTYADFIEAIDNLCMKNWAEVKKMPGEKEFVASDCERASYINVLLHQAYGFTEKDWINIHFVKEIFNTEVGWTLGLVLDHSARYPSHTPEKTMYLVTFVLLFILFVLFVLAAVGFGIHAFNARKGQSTKYHKLDGSYGTI